MFLYMNFNGPTLCEDYHIFKLRVYHINVNTEYIILRLCVFTTPTERKSLSG